MSVRNSNYDTKTFHFPVIALTKRHHIIYHWAELSRHLGRVVSNWAELSVGRVVQAPSYSDAVFMEVGRTICLHGPKQSGRTICLRGPKRLGRTMRWSASKRLSRTICWRGPKRLGRTIRDPKDPLNASLTIHIIAHSPLDSVLRIIIYVGVRFVFDVSSYSSGYLVESEDKLLTC